MLRKLLLLAAPLLIVLALEALFRAGLWEPLARPDSHPGTSVRLKRMLTSADLTRVDYVTLGSSRPLYGLDHARIAASAHGRGFVHANLSMPGTHWMTIGALGRWLASHRPEVRGGIVALSIQDFSWPGNGSYELGIVQPFRAFFAVSDTMPYVPFDGSRIDTYGSRSALFEWREDVRDFARNPGKRLGTLRWYQRNRSSAQQLFANPESEGDMCAIGVTALSACDRTNDMDDGKSRQLAGQCELLRREATNRFDFRPAMASASPPERMARIRSGVERALRMLEWQETPVVVLMPVPALWKRDVLGRGQHEWARAVLQPLVDEGRIRVIDGTDFFSADSDGGCSAFFDFYHQNASGRERFTDWLLPRIAADAVPGTIGYPGIAPRQIPPTR